MTYEVQLVSNINAHNQVLLIVVLIMQDDKTVSGLQLLVSVNKN